MNERSEIRPKKHQKTRIRSVAHDLERLKTKYVPSVSECVPTICGPKKTNDLLVSQMHHSGVFDRDEQMS